MDKELSRMINVLLTINNNLSLLDHDNEAELIKLKLKSKLIEGIK